MLLSKDGRNIFFRVKCEAGTYVRKLVSDIGKHLGCGAHMQSLRRTKVGPFSVKEAVSLEELRKNPGKHLLPLEAVLERTGIRKAIVKDGYVKNVRNGAPVKPDMILRTATEDGIAGIFGGNGQIIALGEKKAGVIRILRVFRDRNTRPSGRPIL